MRVWGCRRAFPAAFFIFAAFFSGFTRASGQAVAFHKVRVGRVTAYVVTVNLKSSKVGIHLWVASRPLNNRSFPHESFGAMIARTMPTAAIDGTYYDTRTYRPVGTIVSNGRIVQKGSRGVAVCFDARNRVSFYKIRDWRNFPWQKFKVVISTGPTLVMSGHVSLFPRSEHFRDPEILLPASRSAIGVTRHGKLLLVSVPSRIGLREFARILRKLGAYHAVNLDGGSSTALYYRGRYLVHPSRVLTNILVVYEQKEAVGFRN